MQESELPWLFQEGMGTPDRTVTMHPIIVCTHAPPCNTENQDATNLPDLGKLPIPSINTPNHYTRTFTVRRREKKICGNEGGILRRHAESQARSSIHLKLMKHVHVHIYMLMCQRTNNKSVPPPIDTQHCPNARFCTSLLGQSDEAGS